MIDTKDPNNNTQSTENKEIKIPEFLNQSQQKEYVAPEIKSFKYIKNIQDKKVNWSILKEIDELIGTIVSNDSEPAKAKINYNIIVSTDNRTERVKGTISTTPYRDEDVD